jgi:chemotaxis protein methyltransferase CheR
VSRAPLLTPGAGGGSDFELTDGDFSRIRESVREHTGIALSGAKRQLVYGRLVRRLRALQLPAFGDYIELLERSDPLELEAFTNAITTNLTSFFRESHHFDCLAAQVLRGFAARSGGTGRLRIRSCACSTGEGAYSRQMDSSK